MTNKETFGVTDCKHLKRITVGSTDPANTKTEEQIQEQMDLLNRYLNRGGRIVSQEKNFIIVNVGEHQVILQWVTYHVGFKRKPADIN